MTTLRTSRRRPRTLTLTTVGILTVVAVTSGCEVPDVPPFAGLVTRVAEAPEPNGRDAGDSPTMLPDRTAFVLTGMIERPGDLDLFTIELSGPATLSFRCNQPDLSVQLGDDSLATTSVGGCGSSFTFDSDGGLAFVALNATVATSYEVRIDIDED